MRPNLPRPLAALGLALAAAGPAASPATAGDAMYLPSYHIGSTPMPPVPGVNPGPAVGAPNQAPAPAPPAAEPAAPPAQVGRPQAAARPRSSWPRLAPGTRAPEVHAPTPKARPAILTRPASRRTVVPDGPTAGPTVASELSIAAAPDYVPPSSRGVIARMTRGAEPEVPPGPRRGAPPAELVPPGPLGRGPALADRGEGGAGRRPVDPLLAPVTTSPDAGRSPLGPDGPGLDRAELEARVPRRADDPLLAPRPLVMDPARVDAEPGSIAPADPFAPARLRDVEPAEAPAPAPVMPRRRPIPPLIARPAEGGPA